MRERDSMERVKTYVNGLDKNMQGGIPKGHITLVAGTAGTMKSSLCFNILYNEALHNQKNGIYVSLEQSSESLKKQMEGMGRDMDKIDLMVIKDLSEMNVKLSEANNTEEGTLILVDVGCIRKEIKNIKVNNNKSWLNVIKNVIRKVKEKANSSLFVLDSLSALYVLSKFENPRIELFHIFEFLRDKDLTSFLVSEMPLDGSKYSEYEIEDFLCDGLIVLKLTPFRRKVVREISIAKMRATDCNTDIFSLEFKNQEFHARYGGQNPALD